jgi:hypothetical protein
MAKGAKSTLSHLQLWSLLSALRLQLPGFSFSVFQFFASWPAEQRALGLLKAESASV